MSQPPLVKLKMLWVMGYGLWGRRVHHSSLIIYHSEGGQSLLEMVVLIGLAAVIVTGLTIVTVNGLKNSQFSQNQAQSTRLAQDAIDKIRTMRDQNCPIVNAGTNYYWYDSDPVNRPNQVWAWDPSVNGIKGFSFITVNYNPPGQFGCGPDQPSGNALQSSTTACNDGTLGCDNSLSAALKTTFQRKITISGTTTKNVTVAVSWTDLSGTHQSNLSTIIGQN